MLKLLKGEERSLRASTRPTAACSLEIPTSQLFCGRPEEVGRGRENIP